MQENIFLNHKLKRYGGNKEEYLTDTQLRSFLLEILEHIENALKQAFINEIGENYNNLDFYRDTFKEDIDLFINKKTKFLIKKDEECKKKKGKIEVNIFITKLTFGEFSHLLRKIETKYKKNILKTFGFYKLRFFENWIANIRYFRNLVCHGENIFNRKFEKKIDFYDTLENNNNFKGYFLILGVFCKILGIDDKLLKIGEFLQKKKDAPGVKHISEEIEAWYVLVNSLYKFYVRKSNLKGENIDIIQFMPYFPPHKGGLETHGEQWGKYWVKNGFGKVYNVVTSFEQEIPLSISPHGREVEQIIYLDEVIGYKKDGVEILVCPSVEIISNFPVYKFWSKEYRLIIKYLKEETSTQPSPHQERKQEENYLVITRTRFFLTSFIGGIFAIKRKMRWIHIEHGSDYVKLNSKFKNLVAKIYDKGIGKWIFKRADKVIGVSEACKRFIQKEFVNRYVGVIYRGVDLPDLIDEGVLKNKFGDKIIIGFVGRLFKWKNVDTLIKSYYSLDKDLKNKIQIVIIGEGEDFDRLNELDLNKEIYFTGGKSFEEALELQNEFDIHFHTSSPGGGLATTLLQAMSLGKFIISTPYEGADEVIVDGKNGILLKDDSSEELKIGLEKGLILFDDKKKEFEIENKKIFKEKFDWDKNILKYYKLFNEE